MRNSEVLILPQWRVAHAEPGADVFGNEFDRGAVLERIGLSQILHGFHEQALAVHVTRIGGAFPALIAQLRRNCNRENLGHE
jgi:hypothetical protein